jgi:YD repeat-containing protein
MKTVVILIAVFVATLPGWSQTYTYDAAGRIVSVRYGNGKQSTYTYDGRGNITKRTTATVNSVNGGNDVASVITLSPNPTSSTIMVKLGSVVSGSTSRLIVTDVAGRTVAEQAMERGQVSSTLNVQNLSSGMYIVTFVDGIIEKRSPLIILR